MTTQPRRLLHDLCCQACHHPKGSRERRIILSRLIEAIIESNLLWRENAPYYEDALQLTWIYLSRNLCESETGKQYDARISSVTTWLNAYLKRRLQDFRERDRDESNSRYHPTINTPDPTALLVAEDDIPPILENTRHWIETDPEGILKSIVLKQYPHITCQSLLLRRLPPETAWKDLAAEFDCSISTLASFYQRHCFPQLRKFAQSEGYLE